MILVDRKDMIEIFLKQCVSVINILHFYPLGNGDIIVSRDIL